ncbi:MAG: hypothetical protein HFE73_04045 [Firmicutes bacterium]|nr:hypothetical protein [Bacillota bacterium]
MKKRLLVIVMVALMVILQGTASFAGEETSLKEDFDSLLFEEVENMAQFVSINRGNLGIDEKIPSI